MSEKQKQPEGIIHLDIPLISIHTSPKQISTESNSLNPFPNRSLAGSLIWDTPIEHSGKNPTVFILHEDNCKISETQIPLITAIAQINTPKEVLADPKTDYGKMGDWISMGDFISQYISPALIRQEVSHTDIQRSLERAMVERYRLGYDGTPEPVFSHTINQYLGILRNANNHVATGQWREALALLDYVFDTELQPNSSNEQLIGDIIKLRDYPTNDPHGFVQEIVRGYVRRKDINGIKETDKLAQSIHNQVIHTLRINALQLAQVEYSDSEAAVVHISNTLGKSGAILEHAFIKLQEYHSSGKPFNFIANQYFAANGILLV